MEHTNTQGENSSSVDELATQPQLLPLVTTSSSNPLTEECNVCYQNLRACIETIRRGLGGNLTAIEKAKLRDIDKRLYEHRVRFDIWRSDCNISRGWLSAINVNQEPGLWNLVDSSFVQLNQSLESLKDNIHLMLRQINATDQSSSAQR